jgi:hypothetical protein
VILIAGGIATVWGTLVASGIATVWGILVPSCILGIVASTLATTTWLVIIPVASGLATVF